MMDSDWNNILADVGYAILSKLPDFVDHVYFGSVCKNWYSITREYNQLTRPSRGTLPMYFVPVSECETQRRLCSMSNSNGSHYPINVTLSDIPNKKCCGSSYGWLAFMEEDLSVTLINPFKFKGFTIHLPALKTLATEPYVYTITKLILSPDSTPDNYTVVAIHGGLCQLAIIRSGDNEWTYIEGMNTYAPMQVTLSDIVFHKGFVCALDHQCRIFSIDINCCPVQIRTLNVRNLPLRNTVEEQYFHSYIVESTCRDDLYVLRRGLKKGLTGVVKVLKLELHPENGSIVRIVETESLNGDTVFLSELYSTAVKASNFDWCQPNSVYFIEDYSAGCHPEDMLDDSGIYNVADKTITRLYMRDPNLTYSWRTNTFWVQPPFN